MEDSGRRLPVEDRIRSLPHPLLRVLELVRVLRAPGGCPWDMEQTLRSMTPYLQEETFEVIEAIGAGDAEGLEEELGDLLFLVLFLAEAGESENRTNLDRVADRVVAKLIRRHPHVFAAGESLAPGGAERQWEELKRGEKASGGESEPPTTLGQRPKGLPALTTAYRISEKAGAVGFQWPSVKDALAKLHEEAGELSREIEGENRREALEDEVGDLLYSAVNVARYLGIDPEIALRGTTKKFIKRFQHVEKKLRAEGRTPETSDLEEMGRLWDEAKSEG